MSTSTEGNRRFRLLPEDSYLGWTPYAWLAYLPPLFLQPALGGASATTWAMTSVACLIFLPLYFRGYWARGVESYLIIGAITALGAVLVPFNSSGFVLFIYAAGFAGTQRPVRRALQLLVMLSAILLAEALILELPLWAWVWAFGLTWMVGGVNVHHTSVRVANSKLRMAQEEIEHLATVAERERIARDLHDLLGHTLSLITLKSSLAARVADRDPARAIAEIRDVERISRDALAEVRAAVAGYRDAGLARAVASAEQMLTAGGIAATVAVETVDMTSADEAVLALAVREGVTNVVKHSGASSCSISLVREGDHRRLSIVDNGRWKQAASGSGLAGMRERVDAIGGALSIEHGSETRLTIELPGASRVSTADTEAAPAALHIA
ncbi:MAG: sensor histidine kinase [Gemmatimonadaceae bacterium]|nr:sensor histidine kinase [Gemmatimonadaceae bacterium]